MKNKIYLVLNYVWQNYKKKINFNHILNKCNYFSYMNSIEIVKVLKCDNNIGEIIFKYNDLSNSLKRGAKNTVFYP